VCPPLCLRRAGVGAHGHAPLLRYNAHSFAVRRESAILDLAGQGGLRLQADIADARPDAAAPRVQLAARLSEALRSHAVQVALVVGLAFALRLAWVLVTQWHPLFDDDAFRYDFTARALANGQGYVHLTGDPTAFWPPGYPVLLATAYVVFGEKVIVAQLLNVVLGTATVWLAYLIGRRLFGRGPALLGAGIVACFPSLIFYTGVTLSEITFTFLALLAIYLLIMEAQSQNRLQSPRVENPRLQDRTSSFEPRRALLLLAAGLVLGLAALTRGQALLLPVVLMPFWLRSGVSWRRICPKLAALALGMGLIVAPWTARNAIQLHAPVLIATNAGIDFWIGHNARANGGTDLVGPQELVFSHPELDQVAREVRVNNEGFQKGLSFAAAHPAQELVLPFKKLFWLYYNDEEGLKWNEGHGGQDFLPGPVREGLFALSNVYYFAVLGLLLLGAGRWLSLREPGRLLLLSLVGYWTLIHLVFFGNPRFHAPVMPLVALLAALAWAGALRGREERVH
jgi:4-amino-4-deoxy-L-arabinose transferase-like glycosyltransferase